MQPVIPLPSRQSKPERSTDLDPGVLVRRLQTRVGNCVTRLSPIVPLSWKAKRSPQSTQAVKALMAYYDLNEVKKPTSPDGHKLDCMEHCWALGWRWCYDEMETSGQPHKWYAPATGEGGDYSSSHFGSPLVLPLLKEMGEPVNVERFKDWCEEVQGREDMKKAKREAKKRKRG